MGLGALKEWSLNKGTRDGKIASYFSMKIFVKNILTNVVPMFE